jgi:hypothetical protein
MDGKKLSSDFTLERYGVQVRLANENDSEFILSLRTNEKLSRFLHSTDNDVEKQREWMRNYKVRESNGVDYYFIYYYQGNPFALNRIYDIKSDRATGGSWLCKPGTDVEQSMASAMILRDIMFEILDLDLDVFDVRKGNKKVQKLHAMFGAVKVGESDLDFFYELPKNVYFEHRSNVISMLNL